MIRTFRFRSAIAALALAVPATMMNASNASADTASDYFAGKRLTLVVSYGAGGSYGLYGRLVAVISATICRASRAWWSSTCRAPAG